MTKKKIQEKRERDCFGCTIQELKDNTFMTDWLDPNSILMLSMSIQSDIQELISMGGNTDSQYFNRDETIRQYLNRSKYLVSEAIRLNSLAERIGG